MRALLLIILLVVLSLLAVREFRETRPDAASSIPQAAQGNPAGRATEDLGGTHKQDEAEQATGDAMPPPGARRIVHVPGEAPESEAGPDLESWSVEDAYLEASAKHNLEQALASNLEAALKVELILTRCRGVPDSLDELDQHLERQIQMYAWFRDERPEFTPPDELEIRQRNLDKFAGCRLVKKLFNKELRQRLAELAGQGHVIARYLYASWAPSVKGRPDAFYTHQEWSEKALAFSLANLAEGELAGLVAFAQAYQKPETFTSYNQELGMAFQIVAHECGLDAPYVVANVEHFFNDENYPPFREDTRAAVLAMAEGLRGVCR